MIKWIRNTLTRRTQVRESYRSVFESPQGQDVLRDIVDSGYILKCTFVRGDPHETILREGQRRLALSILRKVYKNDGELQQVIRNTLNEDRNIGTDGS
jgi:hypothetical protein